MRFEIYVYTLMLVDVEGSRVGCGRVDGSHVVCSDILSLRGSYVLRL